MAPQEKQDMMAFQENVDQKGLKVTLAHLNQGSLDAMEIRCMSFRKIMLFPFQGKMNF